MEQLSIPRTELSANQSDSYDESKAYTTTEQMDLGHVEIEREKELKAGELFLVLPLRRNSKNLRGPCKRTRLRYLLQGDVSIRLKA